MEAKRPDTHHPAMDRKLISLKQDYEVRYWTQALGATREELAEAITEVGPSADQVRRYFAHRNALSKS
jgi:hypothetical protein